MNAMLLVVLASLQFPASAPAAAIQSAVLMDNAAVAQKKQQDEKARAESTRRAAIAEAERKAIKDASEKAIADYQTADRHWAYLEQATNEISANTLNVGGMWFRSWRAGDVADRYLSMAVRLEELHKYAMEEGLNSTAIVLHDSAAKFREISQLVSLGGKETVADGTGEYTTRIANAIHSTNTKLSEARKLAFDTRKSTFTIASVKTKEMESAFRE
jgi:hypothetical protein